MFKQFLQLILLPPYILYIVPAISRYLLAGYEYIHNVHILFSFFHLYFCYMSRFMRNAQVGLNISLPFECSSTN